MSHIFRPFTALPFRIAGIGALGASTLLLSGMALANSRRVRPPLLSLSGNVPGTYTAAVSNADAAKTVQFSGSGTLKPFNAIQLTGGVQSPAFVHNGKSTGDITVTAADGTVDLHLTGPLEQGGTSPTLQLTFRITGGTGAYEGAKGGGGLTIRFQALPKAVSKTPPPPPPGQGAPAAQPPSAACQLRFTP